MDNYEYNSVNTEETDEDNKSNKWKYFLRQAFVFSTMCTMFFVNGMAMGAPTVFIPQIRKEHNSTEVIDSSMSSWLSSIFLFASLPWVIIMPILASYCGRKIPFILTTVAMLVGSIVFYCSKNATQILISEALIAIVIATMTTIGCTMGLTEYMSPKYRGTFLTFKSATFFWGIWLSNAIGTFFHWRYIPLVMIILSTYPAITIYFWPESPYYLANKSKLDACVESHRWLKGSSKVAEKELSKLLCTRSGSACEEPKLREVILSKRFYKATLLCICLYTLYALTGKLACAMYSIDIMKKMTSNERTAYTGMLILDGVTVFSMYIGSTLSRIIRRRILLFSSTSVGIASLLLLSLHVYLVKLYYISESEVISIILLSTYSIGIGCGPMIMSLSLYSELVPLQYKSFSVIFIAIIEKLVLGSVVKYTPFMIRNIGLHGAFLCYGLSSSVCLLLIYLYMPETKDKTLFEISDAVHGARNIKHDTNSETSKKLRNVE